jgi:hypothetical protein
MTEPSHAPLAPSSAEKWVHCGRSPSMEAAYPQEDTDETREGTAAHWVLAEMLSDQWHPVGALDPDGTPIDGDMIYAARELVEAIRSVPENGSHLQVESRVHMRQLVHPDNWGTPDAYLIDMPGKTIYIWDYKYGHGYVSERDNWQMIDYAAGVRETYGLNGPFDVVMTIYQPRYYGPEGQLRTYRMPAHELAERIDTLRWAAQSASPNAAATTGAWCFKCSGQIGCDAFTRAVNQIATVVMQTTADAPTPALAGLELRWLTEAQKYLKARVTALEEYVTVAGPGTGYVTEQGYGRERWTVEPSEVFALGDAMGLELRKPPEAITPAQAVKLGLDPEVKAGYSYKPKGEVKLVPLDKSRVVAAFTQE